MRIRPFRIVSVLCLALGLAGSARAADTITSAINSATTEFMKGVVAQYGSNPQVAAALKAVGIKEEELPLLFMIAQQSKKKPEEIAVMRKSGKSWNDVMVTTKVSPEVVYAPATGPVGPPYGNAYGYFRNRQQKDWKSIKLTDEEAVGMANVKYLSQRHQVPPEEIIRRKAQTRGKSFTAIDDDIKKEKQAKAHGRGSAQSQGGNSAGPGNSQGGQGRGKGNGGGNGRGNSGNSGNAGGNGKGPKK